jgi:hypothetical protein
MRTEIAVPSKSISVELFDWLMDHIGTIDNDWNWSKFADNGNNVLFWFTREEDATLFVLRWL